MARKSPGGLIAVLLLACVLPALRVVAVEINDLRKEVERIRGEIAHQDDPKTNPVSQVDQAILFDKYSDNQTVATKNGRLTVGGLVHIWYQHIQNDKTGIVRAAPNNILDPTPGIGANGSGTPIPEPNSVLGNDTFRVRRCELRFKIDITENIDATILMDPSREANVTFSPVPANPNHNAVFNNPHLADGSGQQKGNFIVPQLLQDGYIQFHDLVPHHEFRIGQFKPPSGEESWRNSGTLDFVDRAMVTAINNVRDVGVMLHGTWFNTEKDNSDSGRIQYWLGGFNGADGTVLTDPKIVEGGNRSDDNNDKDIAWRLLGRPLWSEKSWTGKMELGYARTDGHRGASGAAFDPAHAVNGLNKEKTKINRQSAWASYKPNGPVQGWWFRGEWGSGHDRYSKRLPTSLLGVGQLLPKPVTAEGWYFGTGYKVSDSPFNECLNKGGRWCKALSNLELAFRYEVYQNVATENLTNPDRNTDLFKTEAYTSGINYYIKGAYSRVQLNYIVVNDPSEPSRGLRKVKANMLVASFQVMF